MSGRNSVKPREEGAESGVEDSTGVLSLSSVLLVGVKSPGEIVAEDVDSECPCPMRASVFLPLSRIVVLC